MRLCKDISWLFLRCNILETNNPIENMLVNKTTIRLNMLGFLMENIIMSSLHRTMVITMEGYGLGMIYSPIS